jgi:hypothetical protein
MHLHEHLPTAAISLLCLHKHCWKQTEPQSRLGANAPMTDARLETHDGHASARTSQRD